MSDFAYPVLPTFISAKNFPLCSLPYTHTHTYTLNFSQTREHRCPKKNASWSMMVFIAVCCLKLGLDILVQKLENIKDFGTLRIHIWLFLSIGALSTESTNNKSEVFEKKFPKVSKKQNLNFPCTWQILGLPQWLSGKESTCNAGDAGLIPWSGRSPGVGNSNPLLYLCQGKSHGQMSLVGYSPYGCKELDITEQPNTHIVTYTLITQPKMLHGFHFI